MRTSHHMLAGLAALALTADAVGDNGKFIEDIKTKEKDFDSFPGRTFKRASPKIGRNDPCPCNSGKKHKYCHGAKNA